MARYIAYLPDKSECPVVLLVVCNDAVTAEWARTRIAIGLGELGVDDRLRVGEWAGQPQPHH